MLHYYSVYTFVIQCIANLRVGDDAGSASVYLANFTMWYIAYLDWSQVRSTMMAQLWEALIWHFRVKVKLQPSIHPYIAYLRVGGDAGSASMLCQHPLVRGTLSRWFALPQFSTVISLALFLFRACVGASAQYQLLSILTIYLASGWAFPPHFFLYWLLHVIIYNLLQ